MSSNGESKEGLNDGKREESTEWMFIAADSGEMNFANTRKTESEIESRGGL